MSITSVVALLNTALMLLSLVQANPSLPQSTRDYATQVAQQAISQATAALAAQPAPQSKGPISPEGSPTGYTTVFDPSVGMSARFPDTTTLSSDKKNYEVPNASPSQYHSGRVAFDVKKDAASIANCAQGSLPSTMINGLVYAVDYRKDEGARSEVETWTYKTLKNTWCYEISASMTSGVVFVQADYDRIKAANDAIVQSVRIYDLPTVPVSGYSTPVPVVTPSVQLLSPVQGYVVSRKGKMTISWKASTDVRRIVSANIQLIASPNDGSLHPVGSTSPGMFMKTLEPGTSYGSFEEDWGLNDSIPGTYTVTLSVRDCSPKGCDQNPDFPAPGYGPVQTYATSQTVTFTVLDDDQVASLSIERGNQSFLLGVNIKQDLAQKICDAASVTIDSYDKIVCRWGQKILTSNGVKDGGDYINILKPSPNEYMQRNSYSYPIEFLDRTGSTGDSYTVYFRTFAGSSIDKIYERTLSGVVRNNNGTTDASLPYMDLPAGDYYIDMLNLTTGAHGGVGAYLFVR